MSGILVPALYAMSGACAFAALRHGLAVLRRRADPVHIHMETIPDAGDQNRQMRDMLDHLPVAICLKDLDGRYQFINNRFERFFNVKNTDVPGKSDFDLLPREQAEMLRANERLAIERRAEIQSEGLLGRQGTSSLYQSHHFPQLQPDGTPCALCWICVDITEAREKDEALRKFRQQVWHSDRVSSTGAITASLAHELTQPLAAILSNAQAGLRFMGRDEVNLDEIREILEDIVRDDKRAGSVINGLRAMLQQQETPYADVDLGQCLEEVIDMLHGEFVRFNTAIDHRLESQVTVRANKTQIQQVVLNLMMNALEAMTERPAEARNLQVNVTQADGNALVSIRDNGIGIPAEKLDRVFDGFYTTKPQGLGIGLEVCRSIIESHRGRIWAQANPDRGVTFHFTLPLGTGQIAAAKDAARP